MKCFVAVNLSLMKQHILPIAVLFTLSACGGQFSNPLGGSQTTPAGAGGDSVPAAKPVARPTETGVVGGVGRTAASLDKTTAAEKSAATTVPASGGAVLGTTVATLGDPTEQGFWLRTPLVKAETRGSVKTTGGAVVQVKLIPIEGEASAGSRISLAAMRALNLSLTDLATLTVSKS